MSFGHRGRQPRSSVQGVVTHHSLQTTSGDGEMPELKRRSYLSLRDPVSLGKGRSVTIWGYDASGNFVCRLEISNAGVDVYSGEKGGKCLCKLTWEGLVNTLAK